MLNTEELQTQSPNNLAESTEEARYKALETQGMLDEMTWLQSQHWLISIGNSETESTETYPAVFSTQQKAMEFVGVKEDLWNNGYNRNKCYTHPCGYVYYTIQMCPVDPVISEGTLTEIDSKNHEIRMERYEGSCFERFITQISR